MISEWRTPVLRYWLLAAFAMLSVSSCDSRAPAPPPAASVGVPAAESVPSDTGYADEPVPAAESPSNDDGRKLRVRVETLSDADRDLIAEARAVEGANLTESQARQPVEKSNADMSLRNDDFPRTYIESIDVDLANPNHWVRLVWTGPLADRQETGPFRSSPGAGLGRNDCNDVDESRRDGSNCTPKAEAVVEGFSDYLPTYPRCQFVTWFNKPRQIAFHSHWLVPRYPASHGCVRLDSHAAQLIHNNSRIGQTRVTVDGKWSRW